MERVFRRFFSLENYSKDDLIPNYLEELEGHTFDGETPFGKNVNIR